MSRGPTNHVKVFVAYARADVHHLEQLHKHSADLKSNGLEFFDDRNISEGSPDWEAVLLDALDEADIVILLLTPNFINSQFCMEQEVPRALANVEAGKTRVVPLNVVPFFVADRSLIGRMQYMPSGKAISEYRGPARARAWNNVAKLLSKRAKQVSLTRQGARMAGGASGGRIVGVPDVLASNGGRTFAPDQRPTQGGSKWYSSISIISTAIIVISLSLIGMLLLW